MPNLVDPVDAAEAGMRTVEHTTGISKGCSAEAEAIRAGWKELQDSPPEDFRARMMAGGELIRRSADTFDPELCAKTARAYADNGVAVTPTLVNNWSMLNERAVVEDEAAMRFVPAAVRADWVEGLSEERQAAMAQVFGPGQEAAPVKIAALRDAGVTILAGTDIGNPYLAPGYHLHTELEMLVEAGLSPLQALQAATVNPAGTFGLAGETGRVEEGLKADLVLLDADPLDDIANTRAIAAVVVDGRYLDRAALDRLVADAVASN
jgi:imidazolonepropionase-like amidohydrolase